MEGLQLEVNHDGHSVILEIAANWAEKTKYSELDQLP
jgi:hypothetical protein